MIIFADSEQQQYWPIEPESMTRWAHAKPIIDDLAYPCAELADKCTYTPCRRPRGIHIGTIDSVMKQSLSLVLGFVFATHLLYAADMPTIEVALKAVGLDAGAKDRVLAGEIVSKELAEGSDKELAAGLVLQIRAPLAKIMQAVREGKTFEVNRDILAFGRADGDLDKLGYTAEEAGEALAVLNAGPGSKFNLSNAEIGRFRALKVKLKSADPRKDPQALEAINTEYRAILANRLTAYRNGGVKAVAAYSRDKGESKPAEELGLALNESLVGTLFPEFHQALASYPIVPQEGIESEYWWFKQRVERRPIFILAHRMYQQSADHALMMERQIYVGASYNSSQTIAGGVEEGGNVIVLYGNRCFTDQVAGGLSGMKHSIGRGEMINELKAYFENVRKMLEK